jgi:hypothetical protein
MAKKNIYIPDRLYDLMAAEAASRSISFSHACSLAFVHWLRSISKNAELEVKKPAA